MCAGGPNGQTPWQDDEQSVPPAHRRADERVAATYARPWDEPNVARLGGRTRSPGRRATTTRPSVGTSRRSGHGSCVASAR